MTEYSDEELKEMNAEEAKEKLETDEQFERYNELRGEKFQEDINKKKIEDSEKSLDALRDIRDSAKEEQTTTVEIKGREVRVLVDPDLEVWRKVRKIQKFADKKAEDLPTKKVEQLMDTALFVLGKATIDYSEDQWRQVLIEEPKPENKAGLKTLAWLCEKVYSTIEDERESKKNQ